MSLRLVTDEADAVLSVLNKVENGHDIVDSDWKRIFESEGYVRLQKREHSMQRTFENEDFKQFILSKALLDQRRSLSETLDRWKQANLGQAGALALAYLPSNAQIRAKIYPVIKPKENSFVFDLPADPAIFLFLDPNVSKEKFENTLAHELHHIGYGTSCPNEKGMTSIKKMPENSQKVLKWIGAFGEGFAMLAAAGGPDVHPHSVSPLADRIRWDKDVDNFNNDLEIVEQFFLNLSNGKLSDKEENETARSFFGIQGPWYTVGWQMSVVIEKIFGRKKLIDCICDQRKLLITFNKAVKKYNRLNKKQLTHWSKTKY